MIITNSERPKLVVIDGGKETPSTDLNIDHEPDHKEADIPLNRQVLDIVLDIFDNHSPDINYITDQCVEGQSNIKGRIFKVTIIYHITSNQHGPANPDGIRISTIQVSNDQNSIEEYTISQCSVPNPANSVAINLLNNTTSERQIIDDSEAKSLMILLKSLQNIVLVR